MAAMRICPGCRRPNGPHFVRCMGCGTWLGRAPADEGGPTSPRDAASRALRLLDGLTPQRRALLPAEFLRSVQRQSRAMPDGPTADQTADALPAAPRWEPTTSMRRSGPSSFPEPDDTVTAGYNVEDLFPEDDLSWGDHGRGGVSGVWVPAGSGEDTVDGPLEDEPAKDPLADALTRGRGPFGPRDAGWRLLLLPDPDYRSREERLKAALRRVLEIDLYTGLLFLHRPVPTHLASGADPEPLHRAGQRLGEEGLRVIVVERGRWFEGRLPEVVYGASGEAPGPVRLVTAGGGVLPVDRRALRAAVLGELPDRPDVWMLDLFRSEGRPLRVRSDAFDFRCLGPMSVGPKSRLMQRLVRWLSPSPQDPIAIDDRFKLVPDSSRTRRDPSREVTASDVDFTEYSLLSEHIRQL